MLLPIGRVDGCVLNGVAAVEHHVVSHIDAHMGRAGGIIGALEEHQITRSDIGGGHPRTELAQPLRAQPAEAPAHAAVVVDIADKAGAVE